MTPARKLLGTRNAEQAESLGLTPMMGPSCGCSFFLYKGVGMGGRMLSPLRPKGKEAGLLKPVWVRGAPPSVSWADHSWGAIWVT